MRMVVEQDAPTSGHATRGAVALLGGRYRLTLEIDGLPASTEAEILRTAAAGARITARLQQELQRFAEIVEASARTIREEAANRLRIAAERESRAAAGLPEPDHVILPAGTKDPKAVVRRPAVAR